MCDDRAHARADRRRSRAVSRRRAGGARARGLRRRGRGRGRSRSFRRGRRRRPGRRVARRAAAGSRRLLGRRRARGCRRAAGRADLVPRSGRLRPARGGLRSARLHREIEALGGDASPPSWNDGIAGSPGPAEARRCCAIPCWCCLWWSPPGLAVGALGVHEQVAGTRLIADLALAWALTAAALVVLEQPRWRRARWLLLATGLRRSGRGSPVGALERTLDARCSAGAVVGGRSGSARADLSGAAVLAPPGPVADRLCVRGRARRAAARRLRRSRPTESAVRHLRTGTSHTRSTGRRRSRALVLGRGRALPRPPAAARAARGGPALARAAAGRGDGDHPDGSRVAGLGDRDRRCRPVARDDREGGRGVARGRDRRRDPLVSPSAPGSVRARRRAAGTDCDDVARAARAGARRLHARGRLSARRRPVRRCGRAGRSSCRAIPTVPSRR